MGQRRKSPNMKDIKVIDVNASFEGMQAGAYRFDNAYVRFRTQKKKNGEVVDVPGPAQYIGTIFVGVHPNVAFKTPRIGEAEDLV
jgi:hypothetical protein